MFSDNCYLYALSKLPKLGPKRIKQVLAIFENDSKLAWHELKQANVKGISKEFLLFLTQQQKKICLDSINTFLEEEENTFTSYLDDDYPKYLKEIPDPPLFLFYRGQLPKNIPLLTVVGTRTMSQYGFQALAELLSPLCRKGIGIISGLAFGIDAHAHRIALSQNAYTAGILGSGVQNVTPSNHLLLAEEIIESGGALISESPPNAKAYDGSFPRRNRILAGMSKVLFVAEAAKKSGALITAHYALDYNREITTIPGSIFSQTSKGCHHLLQQGATLITSAKELQEIILNDFHKMPSQSDDLSMQEKNVLTLIKTSPQTIDELAYVFTGRSAELFGILTKLELKKLIVNKAGEGYKLS